MGESARPARPALTQQRATFWTLATLVRLANQALLLGRLRIRASAALPTTSAQLAPRRAHRAITRRCRRQAKPLVRRARLASSSTLRTSAANAKNVPQGNSATGRRRPGNATRARQTPTLHRAPPFARAATPTTSLTRVLDLVRLAGRGSFWRLCLASNSALSARQEGTTRQQTKQGWSRPAKFAGRTPSLHPLDQRAVTPVRRELPLKPRRRCAISAHLEHTWAGCHLRVCTGV
mmetsp:Transcript_19392/g.40131  ORF Transcript_19392/g.40131 Transcript_19392/m.40131 type:complete len:235 (-) Transcript_19392:3575-4279(-)